MNPSSLNYTDLTPGDTIYARRYETYHVRFWDDGLLVVRSWDRDGKVWKYRSISEDCWNEWRSFAVVRRKRKVKVWKAIGA